MGHYFDSTSSANWMPEGAQWYSASSPSDGSIWVADDGFKPLEHLGGGWNTHSEGGGYTNSVTNMENLFTVPSIIDSVTGSDEPDSIIIYSIEELNLKVVGEQPYVQSKINTPPWLVANADADKDGLVDIYISHSYEMGNGESHAFYTHVDNFNINKDKLWFIDGYGNTTNGIVVGHEIM